MNRRVHTNIRQGTLIAGLAALAGCAAEPKQTRLDGATQTQIACVQLSPEYESAPRATPGDPAPTAPAERPREDRTEPIALHAFDNFHRIADNRAYRSAQLPAEKLRYVCRTFGIQTVINLRGPNPRQEWYQTEKAVCEELGVKLVDIPWSANHLPPRERLLDLHDAFKNETPPLLIHCSAGADRTGAAAAIYRMLILGQDRATAAKELSFLFGHFSLATPKMDELIEMFQPRRDWIEREYSPPE
jgi:protein tyrosine phosphatase (PTP) superfamily phosphohydrolase (DUF442 family)